MCGIAGVFSLKSEDVSALGAELTNLLKHRGPDDQRHWHNLKYFMGHTRLSIIGIDNGSQPFIEGDEEIIVVANGEIYNHQELRKKYNLKLKSDSDCAIIAPLYEKLGLNFVSELIGMFAFAIFDQNIKKLLIFRDRAGEKPLYYHKNESFFAFASEIRALSSIIPTLTVDDDAILEFFRYQYIPEPNTPFDEIKKLEAGCFIELCMKTGRLELSSYWSMEKSALDKIPLLSNKSPAEQIREAFDEAVQFCSVSDAPVAVSLSGGLDSSAILAASKRKLNDDSLSAITLGYAGNVSTDERDKASELCRILGVEHRTYEASLEEMVELFNTVVIARDDPIGDIAGIGYFIVSRECNKLGIKVLLQGHGADELCWGYDWVRTAACAQFPLPGQHSLFDHMRKMFASKPQLRLFDYQPFVKYGLDNSYHFEHLSLKRTKNLKSFEIGARNERVDIQITSEMFQKYLRENGLSQTDRLGMANSVESRQPFVNHQFVETLLALRYKNPDHRLSGKFLLKEALKDILPPELIDRKKQGFTPPVGELQDLIFTKYMPLILNGTLLSNKKISSEHFLKLLKKRKRNAVESTYLRLVYTLDLWLQQFGQKLRFKG